MKLTVATCQFSIGPDVRRNLRFISRQMREARGRGAHVAHFPETALSGYAGIEFKSFVGFDWVSLEHATREVMALARELKIWVILGSSHRLSRSHKPHNCLYAIDDRGRIVDRYDKRFCTGDRSGQTDDLAHYSPGDHASVVRIRGIECGLLICHDFRYPELYRDYAARGVRVVFHSFHNARTSRETLALRGNIWGAIVRPTLQGNAGSNAVWISANNSTTRLSCWPSFLVRPDGLVAGALPAHRAAVLISTIDPSEELYDASSAWRGSAIRGTLHSGKVVRDARSENRTAL